MDEENSVINNLESFELDTDIKPTTMKHLIKITEVLDKVSSAQATAIQTLKGGKISINGIAKDTGIARQTFYNNPILNQYIERYIASNIRENPYDTIEFLREELRRKDERIARLVNRDASVSKYKAKNQILTDEIGSLRATIQSQEEIINRKVVSFSNRKK